MWMYSSVHETNCVHIVYYVIQESKETIANLSTKVENLKLEMATLRQSLPHHIGGEQGVEMVGGANIMFTRLDMERNTRALQGALEKER